MPFTKGDPNINRNGRPRCAEVDILREALEKAKKNHNNKHFLEHFVEWAYTNHNVAIALAKKLIPDKIEGEGFGGDRLTVIQGSGGVIPDRVQRVVTLLREGTSKA